MSLRELRHRARQPALGLIEQAVRAGVPPAWFGFRRVLRETLRQHCAQANEARLTVVHEQTVARHPLPFNVSDIQRLPAERGWWGYAFRDVPARTCGETLVATLRDCTVVPHLDADREFWVGILTSQQRSLELREVRFRPWHARALRRARRVRTIERATWVTERVFHNYSHWLTAHLPKLVLLREQDALAEVLLPARRPAFVDDSLELLGFEPRRFATFESDEVLRVRELTVLDTDRFRPELLQGVRAASPKVAQHAPHRRVFISRQGAHRRRLLNEEALWPVLREYQFERVRMEELTFPEQVRLMQETEALCAPHGAGMTNMMFCPPGCTVIEMADLSFPNPNFYALASAMGHRYGLVEAEAVGDVHPLERDLRVEVPRLEAALRQAPWLSRVT